MTLVSTEPVPARTEKLLQCDSRFGEGSQIHSNNGMITQTIFFNIQVVYR